MRKIITTLTLALMASVSHAKFYSAGEMLNRLQHKDDQLSALAVGYAVAVFDVGAGVVFCGIPPSTKMAQVATIARAYLIRHPGLHDKPASDVLMFAYIEAFSECERV